MPLYSEDQLDPNGFAPGVTPDPGYDPGFWDEVVPAAFRLENTIGSIKADASPDETEIDPTFDPFDHVPDRHADFIDRYAFVNTMDEVRQMQAQIDRELDDRQTIADLYSRLFQAATLNRFC